MAVRYGEQSRSATSNQEVTVMSNPTVTAITPDEAAVLYRDIDNPLSK